MRAPNINYFFTGTLIDYLRRRGVRQFCLSPGSRSAPMAIVATQHPDITTILIVDERAAAYYAVGYARATGEAAAVICTSGTAVANLFPAVVEAFYSRVPLILITADRPEELQDCGANQTINQENIFGAYAASTTFAAPRLDDDPGTWLTHLEGILHRSSGKPIHINCRLREPLAPTEERFDAIRFQQAVDVWYRTHACSAAADARPNADFERIARSLEGKHRGLIVAGPEVPPKACHAILALAEKLDWPVLGDILSQLRGHPSGNLCIRYDLYLDLPQFASGRTADIVLHFGGVPISKRLNRFLLQHKGIPYIKIQDHGRTIDPDGLETDRVIAHPDDVIAGLLSQPIIDASSELLPRFRAFELEAALVMETYAGRPNLTEPSAAFHIGREIQTGDGLFLSNSMPVRDADSYMNLSVREVAVGCNRGASGIDGLIASAIGFAQGSRRPTTVLAGDLAMLHDLNSLAVAAAAEYPVIIVVINNHGGGIFHFLPLADYPELLARCFTAAHTLSFEPAARMFGLPYYHPKTASELISAYRTARRQNHSAVIEIETDRNENLREHEEIRRRVHDALARS